MRVSALILTALLILGEFPAFAEPVVIELTQTACQFLEVERQDYDFVTHQSDDCIRINLATQKARLADAKVLTLKPGAYIFRVYNRDVPYALGFWLRGQGLGRFTLPSVSGGDIQPGAFKEYPITLEVGEYLYSCPLNPTPDYRLRVQ